ncbi:MAG: NAD(P)-binding protein [Caldilineaceae bacterium]
MRTDDRQAQRRSGSWSMVPDTARTRLADLRVLVVGAGMAGLTAARLLHDSGCRVTVLEARDRGRPHLDRPQPGRPLRPGRLVDSRRRRQSAHKLVPGVGHRPGLHPRRRPRLLRGRPGAAAGAHPGPRRLRLRRGRRQDRTPAGARRRLPAHP